MALPQPASLRTTSVTLRYAQVYEGDTHFVDGYRSTNILSPHVVGAGTIALLIRGTSHRVSAQSNDWCSKMPIDT